MGHLLKIPLKLNHCYVLTLFMVSQGLCRSEGRTGSGGGTVLLPYSCSLCSCCACSLPPMTLFRLACKASKLPSVRGVSQAVQPSPEGECQAGQVLLRMLSPCPCAARCRDFCSSSCCGHSFLHYSRGAFSSTSRCVAPTFSFTLSLPSGRRAELTSSTSCLCTGHLLPCFVLSPLLLIPLSHTSSLL